VNVLPVAGVAVSDADVPVANDPTQLPELQSMPGGVETTPPCPPPAIVTVSVGNALTVTTAAPLTPDDVAVIVVDPGVTAVTVAAAPEPLTVATPGLLDVHVTTGDATGPFVAITVAPSWPVAAGPESVIVPGETSTAVTVTSPPV
jgi:hypothetical protein